MMNRHLKFQYFSQLGHCGFTKFILLECDAVHFTKIKYPLAVAAVLGIMIGLCEPLETTLSLSRTFVFFPFFLAGFYMKKNILKS